MAHQSGVRDKRSGFYAQFLALVTAACSDFTLVTSAKHLME